jgi:uncharacterized protein (DUF58 family)
MQAVLIPIRNRLTRWLFHLQRADALPLTLNARRIYILPTRQGLAFGVLLLGMLLGSINYGLPMGYLFTFLLLGMLLATLLSTWRNLVNLTVLGVDAEPAFAGETVRFSLHLGNHQDRRRWAVAGGLASGDTGYVHLPARGTTALALELPAPHRGRLPLGVCRIHTEYPLGLFHAWAILNPDATALVWPRPSGRRPLPPASGGQAVDGRSTQRGVEDFDGLRAYAPGESPARIVWKTLARQQEPLTKGFVAPAAGDLWLNWEDLAGLDVEARLSQLARWVLDADRSGRPYGLSLPGQALLPLGSGQTHRIRCLNALALHAGGDHQHR